MEEASSNDPEGGTKEENQKCFHLFNCDKTFKFDSVEKLLNSLKDIEEKLNFKTSVEKHYFNLSQMSEVCDTIMSGPQMDFAIFVVHANESRLSINEENAGIGYAKIYKALVEKTGGKVIIVIGGDDNYKDVAEEQSSVLSRWARRKVSSQFDEQFLDGRKSFIFSWDREHKPIHEEAMLHFLDPEKEGETFVPKPVPVEPMVPQVDPNKAAKSQESTEIDANADPEGNLVNIETQTPDGQKTETRSEEEKIHNQDPLPTDETQSHGFEFLTPEIEEPMDQSEDFVNVNLGDASNEDALTKSGPAPLQHSQGTKADNSPVRVNTAILYRDQSDIDAINEVFGEAVRDIAPVTISALSDFKDFLSGNQTVGSCFIIVEAGEIIKEMQKKSSGTPYQDLLRKASNTVETKVVIIFCDACNKISRDDENAIIARIEGILGEKGVILWWKGNKRSLQTRRSQFARSQSYPSREDTATKNVKKGSGSKEAAPQITPGDFTLLLKTRLRHGKISYDEQDVVQRLEGWTAPQEIAKRLLEEWESTIDAELLVYRENKTGNPRVKVTEDKDTKLTRLVSGALQTASNYRPSWPQLSIPFCGSDKTPPPNSDLGLD